jgi:hypothetical protein
MKKTSIGHRTWFIEESTGLNVLVGSQSSGGCRRDDDTHHVDVGLLMQGQLALGVFQFQKP